MEFLLSFLLLGLNLLDYERNINSILFLGVGAAIFVGLFFVVHKKTSNFLASCIIMFCHTWQISWINILGSPTSDLQMPWFYIIGALCIGYAILNIRNVLSKPINAAMLIAFITAVIISVSPLINSPSLGEGLKEYIMIMFFLCVTFVALLFADSLDSNVREHIISAYIWCVFISSVFILFQSVAYMFFGRAIFKYAIGNYFGITMTSSSLLMEDTSCSTIMLGSAVFFMLHRIEKKNDPIIHIIIIVITVIALAMTTRRTSILSLVIILCIYAIFHYKGFIKKTVVIGLFAILAGIMLAYLLIARPVDDLSMYLNDNSRIDNYIRAIEISAENPFGVGYDNEYLRTFMDDGIIPHNTILRWLAMGGFWFTAPMIFIIANITYQAFKKKLSAEYWAIIYVIFASNFIPDVLNARFFVIPCMCALMLSENASASNEVVLQLKKQKKRIRIKGFKKA